MGVPRLTVRVSNIPRTAIAEELLSFFESAVGPVFACEIVSAHRNWMSLGFGRVQFESLAAAENACLLSSKSQLPVFQRSNLVVFPSPEDILPRAVDASNRIGGGILHAGILGDEGRMEVFTSWEGVVLEFMPERKKIEIFLEDGRESYKLVVMFDDITASHGCCLGGGGRLNSILLQLKFAPRIYLRVFGTNLKSKFTSDLYYICKEEFQFVYLRTTNFSSTKAFGLSSYFCLELRKGLVVSKIFRKISYYTKMGDVILSKKKKLYV